ncbi:MAG: cytochrome P450 [Alphaproteobacteria bacterium]|nr:cytochrome P450 [Alphaproteobacteria bacterium]
MLQDKTLDSCRVDWPAPDHVPEDRKVSLSWAMGYEPNDLPDPFAPCKWLAGADVPRLLYLPLPPEGAAHGAAGQTAGTWLVTHYDDIERVYSDNDAFSNKGQAEFQAYVGETFRSIPLAIDPPEHSKYRLYLMPHFSPSRLNKMQDGIRQIAAEMIESFADKGEVDIAWDFGRIYPVRIFMDLMGFPKDMFDQFLDWEWDILHSNDPEKIQASMRGILAYLRGFIREKEANPDEHLVSAIVHGKIEGKSPTDDEKIGMVWFLWLGGLDTVAASIGHMFRRMAFEPELQQTIRANPELIPSAVEEFLRSHPVVNSGRRARHDFEWHGVQIKAGDQVQCLNSSGNFDPARFADPETFDPARKANRHFTFVAGVHICLGAPLARRELRILLDEWFKRIPEFHIKPGTDTTVYPGLLSIRHLHIAWDPTARPAR